MNILNRIHLPEDPKKKRLVILSGVLVLIVAGAVGAFYSQLNNTTAPVNIEVGPIDKAVENQLTGQVAVSSLDGLEYPVDIANRRPIGVMVENHPEARPQYGLTRASVIYEAIAEGGITRYLLIYGPKEAERVGPIRSARTYYLDWALEYNAVYVHAGGAANALAKIRSDKSINDIDHLGQPVMWRQRRGSESSEHTLYGNAVYMRSYAKDVGWSDKADFVGWKFAADNRSEEERTTGAIAQITVPYQGSYRVTYDYDAKNNVWKRNLAGKADIDALTSEQITPTNVIVQVMNRSEITSANKTVGELNLYSGGDVWIFSGGKVTKGKWQKAGERKRTIFTDEAGQEIVLTPGQTIVEVVQPGMVPTF